MSALTMYDESGATLKPTLRDHAEISALLAKIGVQFERWQANQPLRERAEQEEVLEAYNEDVKRLNEHYGFRSINVVALTPESRRVAQQVFIRAYP
jgi:1,2-dihydroxy-3-keto-5-methylthiopentene dioxygenase